MDHSTGNPAGRPTDDPAGNSTGEQQFELDLLAHDYVLGQLDAAAAAEWEAQLADDQHAREAVVRAMRLANALVPAEITASPSRTSAQRWFGKPLFAAAAAAAILVATVAIRRGAAGEFDAPGTPAGSNDAELLIASWLDFDTTEIGEDGVGRDPEILGVDATNGIETPTWLMSALDTTTNSEDKK